MTDNRILRRVGDRDSLEVVLGDAGGWRHTATITCKLTGYSSHVLSRHGPERKMPMGGSIINRSGDDDVIDVYGSGPEPIRLRGSGVR